MTGGQMSPATLIGQKTTSSPAGRDLAYNGAPFDVTKALKDFDIAYLARGSVDSPGEVIKVKQYIRKALEKQQRGEGFCLVEVLSPCPTNWGLSPVDSLTFMREKQKAFFQVGEFVDKNAEGGM